jgi:hypothetical protein
MATLPAAFTITVILAILSTQSAQRGAVTTVGTLALVGATHLLEAADPP